LYEARITLKPNQVEMHQKKESYRPISLMNTDGNILNKRIIYHEQVGLIPGMQGQHNIYKSVNVIQHINGIEDKNHTMIYTYI
jgi:hypothetical protein